MRARDDKADGSWGWSKFPLTISRVLREQIDSVSRRGPRPEELALMKRIEAQAVRDRRQHAAAEISAPVQVVKYANSVQQASA